MAIGHSLMCVGVVDGRGAIQIRPVLRVVWRRLFEQIQNVQPLFVDSQHGRHGLTDFNLQIGFQLLQLQSDCFDRLVGYADGFGRGDELFELIVELFDSGLVHVSSLLGIKISCW